MSSNEEAATGIAVIGMGLRLPGAKDSAGYWALLRDGVEAVRFLTAEDLAAAGLDPRLLQHPAYVNAAIRLEDIDLFDAAFFGLSAREAELLDPQQRLFLECAWEALENAGCDPSRARGLVGVYAGVNASHYAFNLYANAELLRTMGMFQISVANDKDHISTRVAYKLNLHGPAITVQTTCSTSLVAICQACQSLLNYQCDLALAGASSILLNQNGYFYQEEGIPSPDGHCRAFDAMAKGTVGGSGIGVVALKRLEDALADGDPIRAVIRGFAVNNDGALKVGYTAPSIDGQAEVISMALAMGGIDPETLGYVEAHGTGTPLGDPIEVAALTQAFRAAGAQRQQYCALGSVKSNLGHLDPAAGVAGLMKTVLCLEQRALPPSLHFKQPNPNIDFAHSPFYVNARLAEWPAQGTPRRAGVSSFGIGGTNAHVVLEEAPVREGGSPSRDWQLLLLSARSQAGVDAACRQLAARLRDGDAPAGALADVAYTLHTGRKAFGWRRMVLASAQEPAPALAALDRAGGAVAVPRDAALALAFVFPGQGSQYVNMGAELYRRERVFRDTFDHCVELLRAHLDDDLRSVVHPSAAAGAPAQARLTQTAWTQPALFSLQYALAQQWQHWGVTPAALAGHSIGELVAACLAGVFSLDDALALVAARGRLMQSMPPGAMLSVMLDAGALELLLPGEVSVAALNAPGLTTVAGPVTAVDAFERTLTARGVGYRRLQTSHAFHSAMMEPIVEPFAQQVRRVALHAPRLPFLSNVSGDWITAAQATDPMYWAHHVRAPVRFADNLQRLLAEPARVLIEVGCGRTIATLAGQVASGPAATPPVVLPSLPAAGEPRSDNECLLDSLGRLWLHGFEPDWAAFYGGERRLRVALPTYPFERQRYWIDAPRPGAAASPAAGAGAREATQWTYAPVWEHSASAQDELAAALAAEPRDWLLLADAGSPGAALAALLRAHGQRVVCVRGGAAFAEIDAEQFEINPGNAADATALVAALARAGRLPRRIVHLLACGLACGHANDDAVQLQSRTVLSLLGLAQALASQPIDGTIDLAFAAEGLHACDADALPEPTKAAAVGLLRVIAQECPVVRCRSVDVESGGDAEQTAQVARQLAAELATCTFEPAVVWRGQTRRTQRWRQRPLAAVDGRPARLRERGVYLITGGLGQIGLALAADLARTAKARLALVARSPLPPRWQWDEMLRARGPAGDVETRTAATVRKLVELERLGAQVMVFAADCADAQAMCAVVERVNAEWGAIHGAIHAAGHTAQASRPLAQIDAGYVASHWRPKAGGVATLAEALDDQPLDFVLLMSSLSALLGGLGFGAYAAANAYLDAFAERRNLQQFTPWISVNWDGWDFSAAAAGDFLLPAEGVDLVRRILDRRLERVAVSVTPLQERLRRWVYLDASATALSAAPQTAAAAGGGTNGAVERHARPSLSSEYEAARNEVETAIVEVWEDLLGVQPIGIHDNYFELGGHSLLAIQVASRLRDQFRVKLAVQTLFEAPTVAELAQRIAQERNGAASAGDAEMSELLSRIEQMSDEEVQALLGEQHG